MKRLLLLIVLVLTISMIFQGFVLAGMLGGRGKSGIEPTSLSGAIVWEQMKKMDYRNKFKMWPGKTSFSQGTEPHGALLTTYVNIPAFMGIAGKKGTMPEGAMIVQENYSSDKKMSAVYVMYKVKAFNPDAGDWFWAKYAPDGKVEAEGKVDVCIKCHTTKKDNDYIFTGPLK